MSKDNIPLETGTPFLDIPPRGLRACLYPILWAFGVLFVCGINGNSLPQIISYEIGIDKVAHCLLFGIQAWLILRVKQNKGQGINWKPIHLAVILSIVFGIIVEGLQATVFINRSYDFADMIANGVGAVSCYLWAYLAYR